MRHTTLKKHVNFYGDWTIGGTTTVIHVLFMIQVIMFWFLILLSAGAERRRVFTGGGSSKISTVSSGRGQGHYDPECRSDPGPWRKTG